MPALPNAMKGYVLTGFGGKDKLQWREDLPIPNPGEGEVLIEVAASSVNNTDINARIGWYSKAVTGGTVEAEAKMTPDTAAILQDWVVNPHLFPRIQGADCCGRIAAVGPGVDPARVGQRVIVRACQIKGPADSPDSFFVFGGGADGAFADYAKVRSRDAFAIDSRLSDIELAAIPVAYSTAEGMFDRVRLAKERVLITGASGGVGSAAVTLAKRRGATVVALASPDKAAAVKAMGADEVLPRDAALEARSFDVVVDLVAGARWPDLIAALRRGGRYVTAGAIAGPHVTLDLRDLYFNDLTFFGTTFQPDHIFPDLVGYIERSEIKPPPIARTFALKDLPQAQEAFLAKSYVGKIAIEVKK